jgi:hypothetical protein
LRAQTGINGTAVTKIIFYSQTRNDAGIMQEYRRNNARIIQE